MDTEPTAISTFGSPLQASNGVPRQRFVYKPKRLRFYKEDPVKERPIDSITPTQSAMDTDTKDIPQEQQSNEIPDAGDNFPITLVEPEVTPQHPDPGNVVQEDTSSIEGSIPLEAVPSMDVTPVETEGNDTLSEVESEHKTPLRKSVDSDPGDFVKIDDADNGNSDEHNAGALKAKVEEADGGRSDGQNAGVVESKDVPTAVVNPLAQEEEKKGAEVESGKVESSQETLEKKSAQKSPYENFLQWMEKNPAAVRCAATAVAVAGIAGIGAIVYARKVRSGGV